MQSKMNEEQHVSLISLYNSLRKRLCRLSPRSSPAVLNEVNQQWQRFLRCLEVNLGAVVSPTVNSFQVTMEGDMWREDSLEVLTYVYEITNGLTQAVCAPEADALSSLEEEVASTATYSLAEIDRLAQRLFMVKTHFLWNKYCDTEPATFRQVIKTSRRLFGQALEKSPEFLQGISPEAHGYFLFAFNEIADMRLVKGPLESLLWEQQLAQHPKQKYWYDWVHYLYLEAMEGSSQASTLANESIENASKLSHFFTVCKGGPNSVMPRRSRSTLSLDLLHVYLSWSPLFTGLSTLIDSAPSIEAVCSGIKRIIETVYHSSAKACHHPAYPFLSLCQVLDPRILLQDTDKGVVETEVWGLSLCVLVLMSLPTTSYTFLQDCIDCFALISDRVKEKRLCLPVELAESIAQVKEANSLGYINVLRSLGPVINCLTAHLSPAKVAELQVYMHPIETFCLTIQRIVEQGDALMVLEQYQAYLQEPGGPPCLDSFLFRPLFDALEALENQLFTFEDENPCSETASNTSRALSSTVDDFVWKPSLTLDPFMDLVSDLIKITYRFTAGPSKILSAVSKVVKGLVTCLKSNALQQAAAEGKFEQVENLLNQGVNPNSDNMFALNIAIVRGHLPVVQLLLPSAMPIYQRDYRWERCRALKTAIHFNREDVLAYLLTYFKSNAMLLMLDNQKALLTDAALCRGYHGMLLVLLNAGIRPQSDGLARLIELGSVKVIACLFDKRENSASESLAWAQGGGKGLVHAAGQGDKEKLRWFLDSGLAYSPVIFERMAIAAASRGQIASLDTLFSSLTPEAIKGAFLEAISCMQFSVVQYLVVTKQVAFESSTLRTAIKGVCKAKASDHHQAMLTCLCAAVVSGEDQDDFNAKRLEHGLTVAVREENVLSVRFFLQQILDQGQSCTPVLCLSIVRIACQQDALELLQLVVGRYPLILTEHLCGFSAVQQAYKTESKRVLWFLLQDPYVQKEIIHSSGQALVFKYRVFSSTVDEVWFKLLLLQQFPASWGFIREILVKISTLYLETCGLGQSIAPRRPCYMTRPSASDCQSPWMELAFKTRDEARSFITKNLSILWDGQAQPLLEEVGMTDYRVKIVERSDQPRGIYGALRGFYPDFVWQGMAIGSQAIYAEASGICPALQLKQRTRLTTLFVDPTKDKNTFTFLAIVQQEQEENKVTYGEFSFQVKLSRPESCSDEAFDLSQLTLEVVNPCECRAVGVFALLRRLRPELHLPAFKHIRLEADSVSSQSMLSLSFFSQTISPVIIDKQQRTGAYNQLEWHLWRLQSHRGQNSLPSVEETAVMKLLHFLDGIIRVSFSEEDFAVFGIGDTNGTSEVAVILHHFPGLKTIETF